MKVYPLECGSLTAPVELMEKGRSGPLTLPVMAFLLVHPDGRTAIFDAGMTPDLDGRVLYGAYACSVPDGHDLASRLRALDVDPDRVDRLVLSHSHFDHIAGVSLVPNAELIIHGSELDAALQGPATSFARIALDLGHPRRTTGDSYDLFGDGSAEVFATPGHTCGHQSLRVRRGQAWDVLAGDACYFCSTLQEDGVQPQAFDPDLYMMTLKRLQAMARAGDLIVPGHDLGFLAWAPPQTTLQLPATAVMG